MEGYYCPWLGIWYISTFDEYLSSAAMEFVIVSDCFDNKL